MGIVRNNHININPHSEAHDMEDDNCALCGDEYTVGWFGCMYCGRGVCENCKDRTYDNRYCTSGCMQDDDQKRYEERERDFDEYMAY